MDQQNLDLAARELLTLITPGYRPPPTFATGLHWMPGLPPFTMAVVDAMRRDYQVRLAMAMKIVPVMKPQFAITGDPEVVEFVENELRSIWTSSITDITEALWYTRFGCEMVYKRADDGLVRFSRMMPYHPRDFKILTKDGEITGLRVVSSSNSHDLSDSGYFPLNNAPPGECNRAVLFAPKCFVYVHEKKFGGFEGMSDAEGAYPSWMEKVREGGAIASRSLWGYKCMFDSGMIIHPEGYWQDPVTNLQVPYREMALKVGESIRNGSVVAVPGTTDGNGNRMWDWIRPEVNGDGQALMTLIDHLDGKINKGFGIPDDVIEQVSGTGSYAGRTIPFIAFLEAGTPTVRNVSRELVRQSLIPLAQINYGESRGKDWEITEANVNTEQFLGAAGGKEGSGVPGDGNGDGIPNEAGQPPQPQQQQMSLADIKRQADHLGLDPVERTLFVQSRMIMKYGRSSVTFHREPSRKVLRARLVQMGQEHDVSQEARATNGEWTFGGSRAARTKELAHKGYSPWERKSVSGDMHAKFDVGMRWHTGEDGLQRPVGTATHYTAMLQPMDLESSEATDPDERLAAEVYASIGEAPFDFSFRNDDAQSGMAFGITGTGNALEVMTNVEALLTRYLFSHRPAVVYFTAKETSRAKLYRKLTARVGMSDDNYRGFQVAGPPGSPALFAIVRDDAVGDFVNSTSRVGMAATDLTTAQHVHQMSLAWSEDDLETVIQMSQDFTDLGQGSFNWDENEHPRADDGKFAHKAVTPDEHAKYDAYHASMTKSGITPRDKDEWVGHVRAVQARLQQHAPKPESTLSDKHQKLLGEIGHVIEGTHPETGSMKPAEHFATVMEPATHADLTHLLTHPEPGDQHKAAMRWEVARRATAEKPEPKAQEPVKEVAKPLFEKPEDPNKIEDFGNKIGGARKDTARKTGPRGTKTEDERPAWQRRYSIGQIAKSMKPGEEGKWSIHDERDTNSWSGGGRQKGGLFNSKEEAEAALPLIAVARNHRVINAGRRGETNYAIIRNVDAHKRPIIKDGFASEDDAMKYLAGHAEEIINTKTIVDDRIHPVLKSVKRVGADFRNGKNAKPDDFKQFGFYGAEFGKWVNDEERQHILNHAYDSFREMADILNIPPNAISLDGELGIGFGSRGHGGKVAGRAHYEPDYGAINLTKLSGAGALAHEWMHGLDHFLGRTSGKAQQGRQTINRNGDKTFDTGRGFSDVAVSHGHPRKLSETYREDLKTAFDGVMHAITKAKVTTAVNHEHHAQQVDRSRKRLEDGIKRFRDALTRDHTQDTYKRGHAKYHKPATGEQMKEVDSLLDQIRAGKVGEKVELPSKKASGGPHVPKVFGRLNEIFHDVRGRNGYTSDSNFEFSGMLGDINYGHQQHAMDRQTHAEMAGKTETESLRTSTFAKEAKKMDQGSKKAYWSEPHELAARAFEAYIYDKIKAGGAGQRNDFLAYRKENSIYGDHKPYPEKEERTAINAAFDKLFSTIKHHELHSSPGPMPARVKGQVSLTSHAEAAAADDQPDDSEEE